MPIYTYECQTCSSSLERRQSFHDEPLKIHDDCGGTLRRVSSPAGIVFKGSGFYNTDYKNGTSGKASETTDSKTDSAKTESKSDSSASSSASSDSSSSSSSDASSSKSEAKSASTSSTPAAATP